MITPEEEPAVSVANSLASIFRWLTVRFYDEYTIAEYFRKQGAHIGQDTRLLVKSLGSEPYLITIEDEVLVSSDVLLVTHDGASWVGRDTRQNLNKYGRVTIHKRAMIGTRAIIMPGVSVGERSIVGAGAVVTRDVPDGMVVAGVPARVIRTTNEYLKRLEDSSLPVAGLDADQKRRLLEQSL